MMGNRPAKQSSIARCFFVDFSSWHVHVGIGWRVQHFGWLLLLFASSEIHQPEPTEKNTYKYFLITIWCGTHKYNVRLRKWFAHHVLSITEIKAMCDCTTNEDDEFSFSHKNNDEQNKVAKYCMWHNHKNDAKETDNSMSLCMVNSCGTRLSYTISNSHRRYCRDSLSCI